jgi:hypothetical protein
MELSELHCCAAVTQRMTGGMALHHWLCKTASAVPQRMLSHCALLLLYSSSIIMCCRSRLLLLYNGHQCSA